jgi:cell division transport system permease protein
MHRNLISLGRIMQAGGRNFIRNAWLSVAATAVMVVTLTVMLGAIILNFAVKDTIAQVTNNLD